MPTLNLNVIDNQRARKYDLPQFCILCLQFPSLPLLVSCAENPENHIWAGREQLKLFDYKTTNDDLLLTLGLRLRKPKIWQCKAELLANHILASLIARA